MWIKKFKLQSHDTIRPLVHSCPSTTVAPMKPTAISQRVGIKPTFTNDSTTNEYSTQLLMAICTGSSNQHDVKFKRADTSSKHANLSVCQALAQWVAKNIYSSRRQTRSRGLVSLFHETDFSSHVMVRRLKNAKHTIHLKILRATGTQMHALSWILLLLF